LQQQNKGAAFPPGPEGPYFHAVNRMKKIIFLFLFCLCPSVWAISPPLKVGMELSYPPFETIDKKGQPCGISVEIAYALGRYLEREIRIENIPYIGLIPSLKSGKIDLILSSMTRTEKRERSISFSDPYLTNGLSLLIAQKSALHDIAEANQKGRKIVVKQATSGQIWAEEHLTEATLVVLDKESSCILEVIQGKADAFIYDQLSVYNAWQKYPQATRVNLHSFQEEPWAIGMRKEDTVLKKEVNAFLKKFRQEGGFTSLRDQYLNQEQNAFKKLGIPFPL
jgi:polar amino acid transport system substrate-binding protein